jgi:hypothetical protein
MYQVIACFGLVRARFVGAESSQMLILVPQLGTRWIFNIWRNCMNDTGSDSDLEPTSARRTRKNSRSVEGMHGCASIEIEFYTI